MLQTQPNHGVPFQTTMDFASAEEISMATFMVITAHLAEGRFTFRFYSHCLISLVVLTRGETFRALRSLVTWTYLIF